MRKIDELGFGRKDVYIAAILFLLAFCVRFYFKMPGLWHTDSVIAARAAEDTLATGRLHYLQGELGYPGEAVLNTLVYAVFRVFGANSAEYSTLFAGVLFGALCIPVMYALSKKLFNSEYVGVYSALILMFMPVHLSLSTYGKPGHVMELFFILSSVYAVIFAGERNSLKLKLLAVALLGLTMAVRQTSVLIIIAFIMLYWRAKPPVEYKRVRKKASIRLTRPYADIALDLAALTIPALIVFALFFVPKTMEDPTFSLPGKIVSVSGEASTGFSLFSSMLQMSFEWATVSMTWLGWALALAGIYLLWKDDKYTTTALMAWFLCFFMYLGNLISTSPRFVIPALAVPVMLSAVALDKIRLKYSQIAAGIVLFILVAWMMYNIYPVIDYRRNHCGPCEFSKKIAETTEPDALMIAMDESQHYEYYAKRKALWRPSGQDLLNPEKLRQNMDYIDGLLSNGTPVYATTQGLSYDMLAEGMLSYNQQEKTLKNMQTGIIYPNIRYDAATRQLYDSQTNAVLPMTGIYGIELANRFSVKPLLVVEDEDWHHSDINKLVYPAVLYKITKREAANVST